ncbi:hypothetical protein QVD17_08599 [Tagetes erecta]|uniref:Uncharacterized protein n=1 Tax=Tagetes erecta TaxID=13708 RepID=A0AAD8KZ77_TARER|nr:hypothetical protein QVD17_08599 [Tagetes erecta]
MIEVLGAAQQSSSYFYKHCNPTSTVTVTPPPPPPVQHPPPLPPPLQPTYRRPNHLPSHSTSTSTITAPQPPPSTTVTDSIHCPNPLPTHLPCPNPPPSSFLFVGFAFGQLWFFRLGVETVPLTLYTRCSIICLNERLPHIAWCSSVLRFFCFFLWVSDEKPGGVMGDTLGNEASSSMEASVRSLDGFWPCPFRGFHCCPDGMTGSKGFPRLMTHIKQMHSSSDDRKSVLRDAVATNVDLFVSVGEALKVSGQWL